MRYKAKLSSHTVCGVEYIDFVVNGQTHTTLKSEFELIYMLDELGISATNRDKILAQVRKVANDWKAEAEIE